MSSIPTKEFKIADIDCELSDICSSINDVQYAIKRLKDDIPDNSFTEETHDSLSNALDYTSQVEDCISNCECEIHATVSCLKKGDILTCGDNIFIVTAAEDMMDVCQSDVEEWDGDVPDVEIKNVKSGEASCFEVTDSRSRYYYEYISADTVEKYRKIYHVINAVMVYEEQQLQVATNPTDNPESETKAEVA